MQYHGRQHVYEASVRLGFGGMAEVYLGKYVDSPDQYVAIKIPREDLSGEYRSIFLREAEAAGRVSSPYVVRVLDWGDSPVFIAFEFVEGDTLEKELSKRQSEQGYWSEGELLGLFRQLAEAMTAINGEVIHRDLKPANIFLQGGLLKVADFGIAKYVGEVTRSRTFKGWGTRAYIAPETIRGDSVDWRADQYSLGVVFFEMATLQRPFTGNADDLEQQHLFVRPKRVTEVASGLAQRLATLISRMLEKDRNKRFSSWQAMLDELDNIAQQRAESDQQPIDDSLVQKAARNIELVRSRELQQQQAAEERRRKEEERFALLNYWADEFFQEVGAQIERLNSSLGEEAIKLTMPGGPKSKTQRECRVSFINANLQVSISNIPIDGPEDLVLWGTVELRTGHRVWVGNIYLSPTPEPYGAWYLVDMKMSGLVRADARPSSEDKEGGSYEVVGNERLVLARNWQAMAFQRRMWNVMSLVDYKQAPLEFDKMLREVLQILVEDAAKEPPGSQARRPMSWGPSR